MVLSGPLSPLDLAEDSQPVLKLAVSKNWWYSERIMIVRLLWTKYAIRVCRLKKNPIFTIYRVLFIRQMNEVEFPNVSFHYMQWVL